MKKQRWRLQRFKHMKQYVSNTYHLWYGSKEIDSKPEGSINGLCLSSYVNPISFFVDLEKPLWLSTTKIGFDELLMFSFCSRRLLHFLSVVGFSAAFPSFSSHFFRTQFVSDEMPMGSLKMATFSWMFRVYLDCVNLTVHALQHFQSVLV